MRQGLGPQGRPDISTLGASQAVYDPGPGQTGQRRARGMKGTPDSNLRENDPPAWKDLGALAA